MGSQHQERPSSNCANSALQAFQGYGFEKYVILAFLGQGENAGRRTFLSADYSNYYQFNMGSAYLGKIPVVP